MDGRSVVLNCEVYVGLLVLGLRFIKKGLCELQVVELDGFDELLVCLVLPSVGCSGGLFLGVGSLLSTLQSGFLLIIIPIPITLLLRQPPPRRVPSSRSLPVNRMHYPFCTLSTLSMLSMLSLLFLLSTLCPGAVCSPVRGDIPFPRKIWSMGLVNIFTGTLQGGVRGDLTLPKGPDRLVALELLKFFRLCDH